MATRVRARLSRAERQEQLLDAASKVLANRDPSVVTLEEVAEAAGVSRALVYNYFDDRAALLSAVRHRSAQRLDSKVISSLRGDDPCRDLARLVRCHVGHAAEDPVGYRQAVTAPGAAATDDRFRRRRLASLRRSIATEPVGGLVAAGVLAALEAMVLHWLDEPDLDVEAAVHAITDTLHGALIGVVPSLA